MAALTIPAALALAASCGGGVDPAMLVGIARVESGLNPVAIHLNSNGTRDYGIAQINEANFTLLGLDAASAMDPCKSFAAASRLLMMFSRYNTGSPSRGLLNGYSAAVTSASQDTRGIRATRGTGGVAVVGSLPDNPTAAACPSIDPEDDGWRVVAGCDQAGDGWRVAAGEAGQ